MALRRYRQVARGRRLPAYARAALRTVDLQSLDNTTSGNLWDAHDSPSRRSRPGGLTLLDVKAELARRLISKCCLCERRCGANRLDGEVGFCGVGSESFCSLEQTLWGEEPPLVPSHEVFFSGCNLRCRFCYSWESLLDTRRGTLVQPQVFADLVARRRREGAANLNLIGGEPTVHLAAILETLQVLDEPTAVVWNSNFYMSSETMRLLDGVVDLYLGDFRFGNDACAREVGGVEGYCAVAQRNFLSAYSSGELVVRHLVLPGHIKCCLEPIAQWVSRNMSGAAFSLMFQYMPCFQALDDPGLCRALTPKEEAEALSIASGYKLNTVRWKRPLKRDGCARPAGEGELTTTVTIRPDGRVAIMHLHSELQHIAKLLTHGGDHNG